MEDGALLLEKTDPFWDTFPNLRIACCLFGWPLVGNKGMKLYLVILGIHSQIHH